MSIFDSFVTSVKNASFNTVSNTFKSMTNRLQLVVYEEQEFNREASCTTLKLDFQSEYSLVELDRNDSNVLSVTYQAKVIDKNDSKVSVSFSHEADSLSLTFKDCMEEHNNPAKYFNLKDPSYQYVPLMFKVIIKIPKLSKFNLIINSKLCIFNHNQIPLKSLVFITSSLQLSDFGTDSNRLELISKKGNIELNNVKTKNIQAMSVLGAVHVSHTECNHIVLSANNGMDLHV
ncbi:hypothetical protein BC833DRAFT_586682 [Globomyces pollinis-pini]|nr:hypothetical protein BC833DRAFT_586682 [Globomyces pollinis-pini]